MSKELYYKLKAKHIISLVEAKERGLVDTVNEIVDELLNKKDLGNMRFKYVNHLCLICGVDLDQVWSMFE